MPYTPAPVDTGHVPVPAELLPLIETLARNTHDVWAAKRTGEGWVYNVKLDAAAKTHPSLVPYEELPESEKEYDRQTALQAVKLLIALGYTLLPPKQKNI